MRRALEGEGPFGSALLQAAEFKSAPTGRSDANGWT